MRRRSAVNCNGPFGLRSAGSKVVAMEIWRCSRPPVPSYGGSAESEMAELVKLGLSTRGLRFTDVTAGLTEITVVAAPLNIDGIWAMSGFRVSGGR